MAHDVLFKVLTQSKLSDGGKGIEFEVKQDDCILGTLRVSKGGLVWFPVNAQKGHQADWSNFNSFMQEQSQTRKR